MLQASELWFVHEVYRAVSSNYCAMKMQKRKSENDGSEEPPISIMLMLQCKA